MSKNDGAPAEDPNLAAFRAILAKKKAAQAAHKPPSNSGNKAKEQKPRPKERMRRRP